jgi:N-terminal domain of toast_rack, DUF2154
MRLLPLLLLLGLMGCYQPEPDDDSVHLVQSPPDIPGQMMRAIRSKGKERAEKMERRLELERERGLLEERAGSIPLGRIDFARLRLEMRQGILEVDSGADELVNANFELLPESVEPVMSYRTIPDNGRLVTLESRSDDDRWRLKLNETIPFSMRVDSEGGYRQLNLRHVPLLDFSLRALEGNSVVSFTGDHQTLSDVALSQADGSISFDMYGDYESLQSMHVDTAHGDIAGSFTGYYSRLNDIRIVATNGNVDLDLDGAWQRICHIDVTATCGDCRLKIPCGVGVSVKVAPCSDNVYAEGMTHIWSNEAYVNEAYGKTAVFLDIRVRATPESRIHVYSDPRGHSDRLVFDTDL